MVNYNNDYIFNNYIFNVVIPWIFFYVLVAWIILRLVAICPENIYFKCELLTIKHSFVLCSFYYQCNDIWFLFFVRHCLPTNASDSQKWHK